MQKSLLLIKASPCKWVNHIITSLLSQVVSILNPHCRFMVLLPVLQLQEQLLALQPDQELLDTDLTKTDHTWHH